MPLIIVIAILTILRFFEIGPTGAISWWWIIGLMAIAFFWFEFGEKMFGLDKRKAHDEMEKARQARVAKNFSNKK
jgi:small Trp-rich protein